MPCGMCGAATPQPDSGGSSPTKHNRPQLLGSCRQLTCKLTCKLTAAEGAVRCTASTNGAATHTNGCNGCKAGNKLLGSHRLALASSIGASSCSFLQPSQSLHCTYTFFPQPLPAIMLSCRARLPSNLQEAAQQSAPPAAACLHAR